MPANKICDSIPCHAIAKGLVLTFAALGIMLATQSRAEPDPAEICSAATRQVSEKSGVPLTAMRDIAIGGPGRDAENALRPWPWTVILDGRSIWFDTEDQALAFVFRNFKKGARDFSVGCFRLNYKQHGQAFASIEQMFDPVLNAEYAARFLLGLRVNLGNWSMAISAYHAADPRIERRQFNRQARAQYDISQDKAANYPNDPARGSPFTIQSRSRRATTVLPDVERPTGGPPERTSAPSATIHFLSGQRG